MMSKTIHDLWNSVYDLHAEWPGNAQDVARIISEVNHSDVPHHESALLRGYIAYHFHCAPTSHIDVEAELETALCGNPSNTTARLYLAHHYYDSGQYCNALDHLQGVDAKEYEQIGQKWRSLKILELSLASKIHLCAEHVRPQDVVKLTNELMAIAPGEAAVPTELVESLLANKCHLVEAWTMPVLREVVAGLRNAIDQIGSRNTLKDKTDMIMA